MLAPCSCDSAALVGVLLMCACSVGELDLEGKTCPCVEGYRCDTVTNTCVSRAVDSGTAPDTAADTSADADAAMDASPGDGGLEDGGLEDGGSDVGPGDTGPADTGPADTGPLDTGPADVGVTTTVVPILVDTYVDNSMPTVSFADGDVLLVDTDPIAYETYIQPADPGLASGTEIVSATLELTCFDIGADVEVHTVTSAWTGSVTWDTRPSMDPSAVASYVTALGAVSVDVTALVQSWVDGAPNYGLVLITLGTDGSDYESTGAASDAVRLVVEYR